MNAAQRLFLEHGVGPVTIEQITTRAAVAKGKFYLYFSSKDDLLGALRKRFAEELLARIRAAIGKQSQAHWKERLSAWAKAIIAGYVASMRLHDILFYAARPPSREGLTDNIIIDDLYRLLAAGVSAGAWSIDDPRFTAVFLFSGVHGVVEEAFAKHRKVDRVRLARKLERLCFRAVGLPNLG
jgi:AcrR family transcriptional regulator